jgi:hypothetical protein
MRENLDSYSTGLILLFLLFPTIIIDFIIQGKGRYCFSANKNL